ncbi:trans-aconitate 2-methyltransferase [Brachybacterium huguangmaarense]
MAHTWDPDRYLAFGDERGRPFLDLVARIGAEDPRAVVDLGAGPGTLTALLHRRWPDAHVLAVDASPEMIERARAVDGVEARLGDLRDWAPGAPVDVVVTNAALQWVPGHRELLPRLVGHLAPGGWFAMQVPGNHEAPSHALLRGLAADPRYSRWTAGVEHPVSDDPSDYLRALQDTGCEVDAWETTYLHVLTGEDPVLTWISGTGARPVLAALPDDVRGAFVEEYAALLREAYPADAQGRVVLPFRRVFAVAHRA